jgi:MFS transporter, UMF1 family
MNTTEKGNKKIISAWATFDLANSVYNLVITATIFPIYFKSVTTKKDEAGNILSENVELFGMTFKNTALYDYALALAYLMVAILSPLLSGIADYGGSKKRFMMFFTYLGASACSLMYFFDASNIGFGVLLAVLACVGYSGSLVFYNAYLPEIAEPEEQDKVSAKGFARGYWGSSLLLIFNLILVKNYEWFGIETVGQATGIAFLTVGIWWIGFAQIPFYYLPNNINTKKSSDNRFKKGYLELIKVWNDLKNNRGLTRFLPAFFIYSMGVQTVMLVATLFASTEILNPDGTPMNSGNLITTILIIQFVAMLGAYLFSFSSRKLGNLMTLKIATIIWALICVVTYLFVHYTYQFYLVAMLVGLVMGGIQSLSRSTYSKMLPETEDHSSYFSFYDVCEKMSIVLGMGIFGFINDHSVSMRPPLIALILFFVLGYLLLLRVPKPKALA